MAKKQSMLDKLLGRNKPEPEPEPIEFKPEQEKEEPKVEEFMEIGNSPVPGITLRHILRGHTDIINRIAWSPDGRYLASPSNDNNISIWDAERGERVAVLSEHKNAVFNVAWSPNNQMIASCGIGSLILIWDFKTGAIKKQLHLDPSTKYIHGLSWSQNGNNLAISGIGDGKLPITGIWELGSGKLLKSLDGHTDTVRSILWTTNRENVVSASDDGSIRIWNTNTGTAIKTYEVKGRDSNDIWALALHPNGQIIASCGENSVIYLWHLDKDQEYRILEGHTKWIKSISFSSNGKLLASKSYDGTVRIWNCENWDVVAVLMEYGKDPNHTYLAFHPSLPRLATLGEDNHVIRVWDINYEILIGNKPVVESIHYTTAKLVLVGDSGVGKTGLGWRLAHNEFKEHSSTHGQQFWVVPELKKTREDGTECEAVLWDLAGQHIYRSIHSIFLDDVDASLVLFDPTNRQEPLKGAQFWLEQLKGKKQLPPSVLVGARLDRGAPVLSQKELDQFCQKYGISGGYIGTSAKTGEGVNNLIETLQTQIPWDQMTATVTTVTFKRIKDYLKTLKEKTDRKGVLVRPNDLRKQLQATDKDWQFTDAEMMTAVGHLANHGYVTILKSSSGEEYILLVPELLASVASSIFLHADKHPRELGAINETELLQGKYAIDEFRGLEKEEQQVLLDATVVRFLEHSICFRESYGNDNLLIFPSLIKQKRPLKDDVPATDDMSYIVRGRVENIYATLVVLLGYTPSFNRINQWQNQAQYETESGNICGFRLVEDREGEIELILYYGNEMPEDERNDFQTLFEQFLRQRDVKITSFPPVLCPNGHRQERPTVVKRSQEGKEFIFCDECGAKTLLPDLTAQPSFEPEVPDWLKREEATARLRSVYETHLVRVKGHRRGWATPRCYVSYVAEQKEFAERLAHDLTDAGVFVLDEASKVESNDSIIVIDSSSYQKAWQSGTIQNEITLIRTRLTDKYRGLTYINQAGNTFEHTLEHCESRSFCEPTHYVINLFDLVLKLYAISLNQAGFIELRQTLHQHWEQTLAPKVKFEQDVTVSSSGSQKEIFVSYAWGGESEKLVNEIDQAFLKKGVLITRDKRDLGYKGSIKEFMQRIGQGKGIVVVISDKYLKSKNCMFELLQIAENQRFRDRIFPVVLSDANIYEAVKRIEYIKYWEAKKKELAKAMRGVSPEHLEGIRQEIDLFDNIRDEIAKLTDILQDMNTLTPDMHRDSEFQTLFDKVVAKLEE